METNPLNPSNHKKVGLKRWLAVVLTCGLLLSMLPIYAASAFSRPGPDDYRYGYRTHEAWLQTGEVGAVLTAAWKEANVTYTQWQGSYSAIFLMALEPGIFSAGAYGLSTYLLLTVFVAGMLLFCYALFTRILGMEKTGAWMGGVLMTMATVQFVPYPCEAFFWFNGSVYYTFFFSLSLILGALFILRREKRSWIQWVFSLLLALIIGGGNLITGLLSCVLLGLYTLHGLCKKEKDWLPGATLCLLAAGFFINALAPGNGVRQQEHLSVMAGGPAAAVIAGMRDAIVYGGRWLVNPGTVLSLAAVPLYWTCGDGSARKAVRFRLPGLVTAGSFLLFAAGFTPTEYALGQAGEGRLLNIQYDLFLLLFNINLLWYAGWLHQRLARGKGGAPMRIKPVQAAAMVLAACLLSAGGAVVQRTGTSISATRLLLNGNGASYRADWDERYATLNDLGQRDILFSKMDYKPPLLCLMDLAPSEDDPNYWYNQQVEQYYHKDRILVEGAED